MVEPAAPAVVPVVPLLDEPPVEEVEVEVGPDEVMVELLLELPEVEVEDEDEPDDVLELEGLTNESELGLAELEELELESELPSVLTTMLL